MGSVAKVRKRASAVGGSARKEIQEAVRRQKIAKDCLKLPFFGFFFRFCIDGDLKSLDRENMASMHSVNSSILRPKGNLVTSSLGSSSSSSDPLNASVESTSSSTTGPKTNTYAMKSIHLSRVTDESFVKELKNEVEILKQLDHPHIVRAIETFQHKNQIFIVMELCSGGDLYSRDPYTEEEAARIVSAILSAVSYMHSRNVAHRDLKYENILFENDTPHAQIKLIDFGLSKVYGDNAQLTEGKLVAMEILSWIIPF